jgi:transglutaminase-like putative cysteine protease
MDRAAPAAPASSGPRRERAAFAARLAHLPREARDTLFLLAVIAATVTPHLLELPPWCGAMTVVVLLWRARLALTGAALPGRWVVTGLLVVAGALTFSGERTFLGREAGITMLVVLMALKTLELRARRDALVVFFLGFFLVLTSFLHSQGLLTGLWMLLTLWGLLTALVLAHMPVGRPPLARAGAVAARATLLGVPLMVVLFVLFPRIGPLWGLPTDAAGRTGLSGSMRLGGVASIADDDSIALRVRFQGPAPRPDQLYFRGPVLGRFDGRDWTRAIFGVPAAMRPRAELEARGGALRYEMLIEPSKLALLPMLEMTPGREGMRPEPADFLATLRPDGQWQLDRPLDQRVRIEAAAWLEHRHGPTTYVPGLTELQRLPPGRNPRSLAWAAALRERVEADPAARGDARALAAALLAHIRDGEYVYTLEPGTYEGEQIDEIWFDRKAGFCEHYAAAFVVMMRAMGVPARVVTGYQGVDPEPQDGWYVVRQRNAHAWAEYWLAGEGWLRVDPTAAISPARVLGGQRIRTPPGLVAGALDAIDPAFSLRLRLAWETLNNRWNQWVLNYSRGQQFDLLRALGVERPSGQDLAHLLIALLAAVALAGAGWAWWDRRRQDPWQRLQRRVQQRLAALGVTVAAHDAPHTRAARVRAALGARGEALARQLDALARARYAAGHAGPSLRGWWPGFAAAARAAAARGEA